MGARLFWISWGVAVPIAWAATILLWVLGPSEEAVYAVMVPAGVVPVAWTLYGGFVLLRRTWQSDIDRIAAAWTIALLGSLPLTALTLRDAGEQLLAGYAIGIAAGLLSAGIYLPFTAVVYCAWLAGTSRRRAIRIAATAAGIVAWTIAAVLDAALGQSG